MRGLRACIPKLLGFLGGLEVGIRLSGDRLLGVLLHLRIFRGQLVGKPFPLKRIADHRLAVLVWFDCLLRCVRLCVFFGLPAGFPFRKVVVDFLQRRLEAVGEKVLIEGGLNVDPQLGPNGLQPHGPILKIGERSGHVGRQAGEGDNDQGDAAGRRCQSRKYGTGGCQSFHGQRGRDRCGP